MVEVVAQVRGLPARALPGLGFPSARPASLVTVAALLFVATPSVVAAFPSAPVHAILPAPLHQAPSVSAAVVSAPAPSMRPLRPSRPRSTGRPSTTPSSAATASGRSPNGCSATATRFPEIVDLNKAVLNGRPDFITSGTVLKVPHEVTESDTAYREAQYVVKTGDTLSGIAEAKLGDPLRYPELFEASRDTVQPDGESLTDPDLIRLGWEITIPGHAKHKAGPPEESPDQTAPPSTVEPPSKPPPMSRLPRPDAGPAAEPHSAANPTADGGDGATESAGPGWLLPGLTGAGAVLAALVLLAVRATATPNSDTAARTDHRPSTTGTARRREDSIRLRRIPDRTYRTTRSRARHLAGECLDAHRPLPAADHRDVVRGCRRPSISPRTLTFRHRGRARARVVPRLDEPVPDRPDVLPPYPLLVTVRAGRRRAPPREPGTPRRRGARWRPGSHHGSCPPYRGRARTQSLVVLVEVDLIGLGEELAPLDPVRLRHHADGEQVVASIAHDVAAALAERWRRPRPLPRGHHDRRWDSDLAPLLASPSSRVGAALVRGSPPVPGSTVIDMDNDGRLTRPSSDSTSKPPA